MEYSPKLGLPYVAEAQAQKHITVNEGFQFLDALVQLTAVSATIATEPMTPTAGDIYILPSGATGAAWENMAEGSLAAFLGNAWIEITPHRGYRILVADTGRYLMFGDQGWAGPSQFGVNTLPGATNRLAVKSDAELLSHDDVTPGSGDARKLINKADAGKTASVLFQTGFSGRAEIGTVGDDDLRLKVSADGTSWRDALFVDGVSGKIGIGTDEPAGEIDIASSAPNLFLTNTAAGTDADGSWFSTVDYQSGDGTSSYRVVNGGFGFGSGGIALDLQKDASETGRVGYFKTAVSDAIFIAAANLNVTNSDGFRFEFNNSGDGGHAVFKARSTVSTSATQRAFEANNAGTANFYATMGGNGYFAGKVGVGTESPVCEIDSAGPIRVGVFTVAALPSATTGAGQIVYVSDENGGGVLAFSDGTDWRRATDRAVVS